MKRTLLYVAISTFFMFSCDTSRFQHPDNLATDDETSLTRAGKDEPKTCDQCFIYYILEIPYSCRTCGVQAPVVIPEEGPVPEFPEIPDPAENQFYFDVYVNNGYNVKDGVVYLDKDGGSIPITLYADMIRGDLPTAFSYPNGYFWHVTYLSRNSDFFIGRSGGFITAGNTGLVNMEISRGPNAGTEPKYIKFIFNGTVDYCSSSPVYSETGTFQKEHTISVIQPGGSLLPEVPIVMPPSEGEEEPADDDSEEVVQ